MIEKRIKHIEMVLRQIDVYLANSEQPIKSSYLTPYLHASKMIDYWDLPLLIFPFLQWVVTGMIFCKTTIQIILMLMV